MQEPTPPAPPAAEASQRVQTLGREMGFGLVGIAGAEPSGYRDAVRAWIADGRHGEMGYLADHLETRLDPRKLLDGARSVICVADFYPAEAEIEPSGAEPHGRIARYAYGDDYHKTIKKRLHALADALSEQYPGERFRSTVDTAPILEREYAAAAGLGWIGKHTLLIHPQLGSYMLLGTIVTTLDLATSEQSGYAGARDSGASDSEPNPGAAFPLVPPTDHCGTCTRCIDACPTDCISHSGPRAVDATRCISYLTLEHRSPIDESLHPMMGGWIAGCDVCQEVCPHNRERGPGDGNLDKHEGGDTVPALGSVPMHPAYTPRPPAPGVSLLDVLNWTEDDRRAAVRGSALKRIKLGMFKRNALIAAGNYLGEQESDALYQRVVQLAEDENELELVRVTARQVLAKLERGSGPADR